MNFDWDDIRLFLDVAHFGGLSAATSATGLSAATLGRRINKLEKQFGRALFTRAQTGYQLTQSGEELLMQAQDVVSAMQNLNRWNDGTLVKRLVRISAGSWTSTFLSQHIGELWRLDEGIGVELVTASRKIDIGHRHAEIGIRNNRPTENWLAGRRIGSVSFALYSGRMPVGSPASGLFIGISVNPGLKWVLIPE